MFDSQIIAQLPQDGQDSFKTGLKLLAQSGAIERQIETWRDQLAEGMLHESVEILAEQILAFRERVATMRELVQLANQF